MPVFLTLGPWADQRHWLETLLVSAGFMLQALLLMFFLTGSGLI